MAAHPNALKKWEKVRDHVPAGGGDYPMRVTVGLRGATVSGHAPRAGARPGTAP